ncbi:hypothetical protein N7509_011759 [Penicillium cosmopolitanum]|uniref:Uncharacterized protein n=1 Tax=Penicillium cosmopolitanum TaxID=1131564 RepID=A0A9W9VGG4_9EURO|nr:uncharacterized protein N7509_011759 [Penicillium cosmopolitanum]KAJ5378640.1 hypothetical protein N7509_011759 [Penicillium cosmopolitanum]
MRFSASLDSASSPGAPVNSTCGVDGVWGQGKPINRKRWITSEKSTQIGTREMRRRLCYTYPELETRCGSLGKYLEYSFSGLPSGLHIRSTQLDDRAVRRLGLRGSWDPRHHNVDGEKRIKKANEHPGALLFIHIANSGLPGATTKAYTPVDQEG